ncbi:diguanylate cyclase (GGDEF) domain-containing protein [Thauera chlorobenzoica]|uniref:diguanylate cyclase n=1 Tax=Thauera chlorobenzoica TaxID=96773 RepID=A0A1H5UE04_9RHOO|nr:Serine/threonine kinase [Thauera chlorobenzoica]SEF72591.1 diguanylate cyclase (GGDEF) domain-containing protein [Thauera chlorobenzoica]
MPGFRHLGVRVWASVLLVLCLGTALTVAIAQYDRRLGERSQSSRIEVRLQAAAFQLERTLSALVQLNHDVAAAILPERTVTAEKLRPLAEKLINDHRRIINVAVSRGLEVVFVHPLEGNEAVLGMHFDSRPEQMEGVRRAIERRTTVIAGPLSLVQSGRPGLIVRTPVFHPATAGEPGELWGMVSSVVELEGILEDAGLSSPALPLTLAIRGREGSGAQGPPFHGDPDLFRRPHVAVDVALPAGGRWRLAAAPPADDTEAAARRTRIYAGGSAISLTLALLLLYRSGAFGRGRSANPAPPFLPARTRIGIRAFLTGASLLALLPILAIGGWVSYRTAQQSTERFSQALAREIGDRLHDRVAAFFEVPRHFVAFNIEQARAGLLRHEKPEDLMRGFLSQIRQQPLLTFVSMGMADGEYYAASRPPHGADKALRMLHSRISDDYVMHIFRTDQTGRSTSLMSTGKGRFDARRRPWFEAALDSGSLAWYPAYRYAINDAEGAYDTMGIGMSAPLFDPHGSFIGVATADVALSQLSEFLRELTAGTRATAFIAEANGLLLANSALAPIYRLDGEEAVRIPLAESDSPLIRAAARTLTASAHPEGSASIPIDGGNFLFEWHSFALAQGPTLTIGLILPTSHFEAMASDTLRNILYLALAVMILSLMIGLVAADWVARPLGALSRASSRLARGNWQRTSGEPGPIREVATLFHAMDCVAAQLKRHTETLEHKVRERTEELEAANHKLAMLSLTDGLTGISNRRHFDEMLHSEWARALRTAQPLAILMVDIDLFKKYNDHYGHQAGDECLTRVAHAIQSCVKRAGDLVARYGGEEFAVICAESDLEKATALADILCHAVAAQALPHVLSPHGRVTVSIGVAATVPTPEVAPETLLRRADEALYRAKAGGRNRVNAETGNPQLVPAGPA